MRKFYLLALLFLGVCAFSACSDDDDENNNAEIAGTWSIVKKYWLDKDGKLAGEEKVYDKGAWTYTFKADGTGEEFDEEDDEKYPFNFTYAGGKLTIDWGEDEKVTFNVSVNKDGSMVFKDTEMDEDEEYWVLELTK